MADKYLINDGAKFKQVEATTVSTGVAQAGKIPALGADGRFSASMMPAGYGDDAKAFPASEDLAAGDLVNIFNDAGTPKARKADVSAGKGYIAHGFVKAAGLSGDNVTVYFEGVNNALTGLTAGGEYYVDLANPGKVALVSALTPVAGDLLQRVGNAISATELSFEAAFPPVEVA